MAYRLEFMADEHRTSVINIINYYIENSFAAYLEERVGDDFFKWLLTMAAGYPAVVAKTQKGEVIGFALLHSYHPAKSFHRTAEATYFILPEHTNKGVGKTILDFFVEESRKMGIDNLMASISSLNEESLKFHRKYGFKECGRFKKAGRRFGKDFDVVWMQKHI